MMVASPIRPMRFTESLRLLSRSGAVWRELRKSQTPPAIRRMAIRPRMVTSRAPPGKRTLAPALGIDSYPSLPDGLAADRRFLKYLGIILQELFETLIRERMVEQHIEHFERHRRDVGAGRGRFDHVDGRPDRRSQNLCLVTVILVNRGNGPDQVHAGLSDIVKASHERADDIGAGLGGDQRLRRRKAERHIDANMLIAQR